MPTLQNCQILLPKLQKNRLAQIMNKTLRTIRIKNTQFFSTMIKNTIKPLGNRVLLEPKPAEQQTASGIYLPSSAQDNQMQATVVAVGTDQNIEVKKGDTVLYNQHAGTTLETDNGKLIIIESSDILAVI